MGAKIRLIRGDVETFGNNTAWDTQHDIIERQYILVQLFL